MSRLMHLKNVLKAGLAMPVLSSDAFWQRRLDEQAMVALCYHRVGDSGIDPYALRVGTVEFDRQMAILAAHPALEPVSVFRFDAIWHGDEPYPGRVPVLVSFDDGYRDNLTRAAPILAQRGVPCVLFTVASLLDGEALWYDVIADVVERGRAAELGTLLPDANPPDTCNAVGWVAAVNSLRGATALRAIDALRAKGRRLERDRRYLSVEDLEDWCKAGFHVGAHTNTHPRLAALDIEQARIEITASQKTLADRLGRPVVHFAYPFGCQGDFSAEHAALLDASGLRLAFTTVPGRNRPGADPFAVRRRCVSGGQFRVGDDVCSETLFLAYLMGWPAPLPERLAARGGRRATA